MTDSFFALFDGLSVENGVFSISFGAPASLAKLDGDNSKQVPFPFGEYIGDTNNPLVRAVTDDLLAPNPFFNPLVFVGVSGTGKSLLVRGLAQRWLCAHPNKKIVNTNGVDFARSFAAASEADAIDELRSKFRGCDLLLVDDLHQIVGKRSAQIELRQTIDALLYKQCPVLISMRRLPTEHKPLLPDLISRISTGVTIPLDFPGPAARREILGRIAAAHQLELSDCTLKSLADELTGSVPHLTNTLLQLSNSIANSSKRISACHVKQFLMTRMQATEPSLRLISSRVARFYQQTTNDLKGPTRRRAVVHARGVAMYLSRQLTSQSLNQIGRHFGGRDHTTVLHACRKMESLVKTDEVACHAIDELRDSICSV